MAPSNPPTPLHSSSSAAGHHIEPPQLCLETARQHVQCVFDSSSSAAKAKRHLTGRRQSSSSSVQTTTTTIPNPQCAARSVQQSSARLAATVKQAEVEGKLQQALLHDQMWAAHAAAATGAVAASSSSSNNPQNLAGSSSSLNPAAADQSGADAVLASTHNSVSSTMVNYGSFARASRKPSVMSSSQLEHAATAAAAASANTSRAASPNPAMLGGSAAMSGAVAGANKMMARRPSLNHLRARSNSLSSSVMAGAASGPASPLLSGVMSPASPHTPSVSTAFSMNPALKQVAGRHAAAALFQVLSIAAAFDVDLSAPPPPLLTSTSSEQQQQQQNQEQATSAAAGTALADAGSSSSLPAQSGSSTAGLIQLMGSSGTTFPPMHSDPAGRSNTTTIAPAAVSSSSQNQFLLPPASASVSAATSRSSYPSFRAFAEESQQQQQQQQAPLLSLVGTSINRLGAANRLRRNASMNSMNSENTSASSGQTARPPNSSGGASFSSAAAAAAANAVAPAVQPAALSSSTNAASSPPTDSTASNTASAEHVVLAQHRDQLLEQQALWQQQKHRMHAQAALLKSLGSVRPEVQHERLVRSMSVVLERRAASIRARSGSVRRMSLPPSTSSAAMSKMQQQQQQKVPSPLFAPPQHRSTAVADHVADLAGASSTSIPSAVAHDVTAPPSRRQSHANDAEAAANPGFVPTIDSFDDVAQEVESEAGDHQGKMRLGNTQQSTASTDGGHIPSFEQASPAPGDAMHRIFDFSRAAVASGDDHTNNNIVSLLGQKRAPPTNNIGFLASLGSTSSHAATSGEENNHQHHHQQQQQNGGASSSLLPTASASARRPFSLAQLGSSSSSSSGSKIPPTSSSAPVARRPGASSSSAAAVAADVAAVPVLPRALRMADGGSAGASPSNSAPSSTTATAQVSGNWVAGSQALIGMRLPMGDSQDDLAVTGSGQSTDQPGQSPMVQSVTSYVGNPADIQIQQYTSYSGHFPATEDSAHQGQQQQQQQQGGANRNLSVPHSTNLQLIGGGGGGAHSTSSHPGDNNYSLPMIPSAAGLSELGEAVESHYGGDGSSPANLSPVAAGESNSSLAVYHQQLQQQQQQQVIAPAAARLRHGSATQQQQQQQILNTSNNTGRSSTSSHNRSGSSRTHSRHPSGLIALNMEESPERPQLFVLPSSLPPAGAVPVPPLPTTVNNNNNNNSPPSSQQQHEVVPQIQVLPIHTITPESPHPHELQQQQQQQQQQNNSNDDSGIHHNSGAGGSSPNVHDQTHRGGSNGSADSIASGVNFALPPSAHAESISERSGAEGQQQQQPQNQRSFPEFEYVESG